MRGPPWDRGNLLKVEEGCSGGGKMGVLEGV